MQDEESEQLAAKGRKRKARGRHGCDLSGTVTALSCLSGRRSSFSSGKKGAGGSRKVTDTVLQIEGLTLECNIGPD